MTKESSLEVYYCFGAVSILCSLYVIFNILQIGIETSPTKIILCLHLTVLIENITTFPAVFTGNAGLCAFLGFLRTYFGFANAIVVFMIVFHYRYIFIVDSLKIKEWVSKKREQIIFFAPIITLLPFFTNGYGEDRSIWCSIQQDTAINYTWSFAVYYGWIIAIISLSALLFLHTVVQVYLADPTIASSLIKSIGFYAIISILSWFPRFLAAFGTIAPINANIFLYFSGMAYWVTFQLEKESLKAFEENAQQFAVADNSDNGSVYISWQFDSTFFRMDSKSDADTTPRSSLGKTSPAHHSQLSRSLIVRSIQKIGAMLSTGSNSASRVPGPPSSGQSSAHSSANRGEISPIQPSEEVHNIILEAPPPPPPRPAVTAPVSAIQHKNRPASANLVSFVGNTAGTYNPPDVSAVVPANTTANNTTNNTATGSTEKLNRRSMIINYSNIAKYNMNVDDSGGRSRPHSTRQTPAKAPREDVESGGHSTAPDSENKRPRSQRTGKSQGDGNNKRPSSLRLSQIGRIDNSHSVAVDNSHTYNYNNSDRGAGDIQNALERAYRRDISTIAEEDQREENSESQKVSSGGMEEKDGQIDI
eukprot:gene5166-5534_t